jgi:Arc/MetJ-type ribon-helix-helix transcriptional regulator
MQKSDPRWRKFWQNVLWFAGTLAVLVILFRFLPGFVVLFALWGVGLIWGGFLAYKLSRLLFGTDTIVVSDGRSRVYLEQALDYKDKINKAIRNTSNLTRQTNLKQLADQVTDLVEAIEALVERIGGFRHDDVIRRDLQKVPQAIKDLESRLESESDPTIRTQLERTLANRRKQLESLETLQGIIKRAEIQIESTLSQLGTIYSQLLTSESTSQVADYSRLSTDVDEEVRLLQDHLEALREVKLGGG